LVAAPWDDSAASGSDGEGETWHRVTLAEGIEVHYRPSTRARNRQLVDRLLEAARKALESNPGTPSEE
jgi:hypothetical protein